MMKYKSKEINGMTLMWFLLLCYEYVDLIDLMYSMLGCVWSFRIGQAVNSSFFNVTNITSIS